MLPGYNAHKDTMSVDEYVERVVRGELADPTLTPQLRNGFVVRGIMPNYIDDARITHHATLIVWENPDYRPVAGRNWEDA